MSLEVPLILEIQKHPCLYNSNLAEYNRKDTLDSSWTEVAAAVNLTVAECKDKWKNIRSSYVRSLRTHRGKTKKPYYLSKYLKFVYPYLKPREDITGQNIQDDSLQTEINTISDDNSIEEMVQIKQEEEVQVQYEGISFDPLVDEEKEIEALEETLAEVDSDGSERFLRKRRRQAMLKRDSRNNKNKSLHTSFGSPRTGNNAMRYFLLSLLPELESMDEEQNRLFKIKVMMLIDEIKTNSLRAREDLSSSRENVRLQKRLTELLLRNLENK